MTEYIDQIELRSKFFAKLVKGDYIEDLEYGVLYVNTGKDDNWQKAIEDVKKTLASPEMKNDKLIKCDVDILPGYADLSQDSNLGLLMREGNAVMPVFVFNGLEQYYLVGNIKEPSFLEFAANLFSVDAQNLLEASIPYALSMLDTEYLESLIKGIQGGSITEEWAGTVKDVTQGAHFVVANSRVSLEKASRQVKKNRVSYKEKNNRIMGLPKTVKKMKDEDDKVRKKALEEFDMTWTALNPHEQALIVREIIKEIKPIALKRIVALTANREILGANTKYNIDILPWKAEFKVYGFDGNYKRCIFIEHNNRLYPLKMQKKSSAVIYTMSLIEKVTKNGKNAIVDVRKNPKAFAEVYNLLFYSDKEIIRKGYEVLFHRYKTNPNLPTRSGRLHEHYHDIEFSLAFAFKSLEDDYLPFLANSETPLALLPEKIRLPEELKDIKIY